ncbi:hypothetical protein WDU94_006872 [Cyamophila willieti]
MVLYGDGEIWMVLYDDGEIWMVLYGDGEIWMVLYGDGEIWMVLYGVGEIWMVLYMVLVRYGWCYMVLVRYGWCYMVDWLLVNLTTPAMILYNEELPTDKVERQLYHQIISHLQKYKVAFANEAFWKILRTKLTSILNIAHTERTEEKGLIAERIIILIRNVLQIPTDPETELCCHDNPNAHDTVVYVLNQAGMLDILIYIAMTPDESHYYLHLLEIMMLMLKEQDPESLAKSDRTRTSTEKEKDEHELKRIRDREVKEKMDRLMKYSSRFGDLCGERVLNANWRKRLRQNPNYPQP